MTGPRSPSAFGPRLRRRWAEATYLLCVAAVATWGFSTDSTATILIAVLLALPTGVPGLVGYYLAYGLLAQLPGASSSAWFTTTMDLTGVLALTGAAVLNVVLLRTLVARRRLRRRVRGPGS